MVSSNEILNLMHYYLDGRLPILGVHPNEVKASRVVYDTDAKGRQSNFRYHAVLKDGTFCSISMDRKLP